MIPRRRNGRTAGRTLLGCSGAIVRPMGRLQRTYATGTTDFFAALDNRTCVRYDPWRYRAISFLDHLIGLPRRDPSTDHRAGHGGSGE